MLTKKQLLEWMNSELHKDKDLKRCQFTDVDKLGQLDKNGCNWSDIVALACSGMSTTACRDRAEFVITNAQKRFNLK